MAMLRPPAFRRQETLPDGRTAYQELWEAPSDPRAKDGIQAWAVLQISWSSGMSAWVPSLRRLYTRKTGVVREVWGTSMQPIRWARITPDGTDLDGARLCADYARLFLPDLIAPDLPIVPHTVAVAIFPPRDVLDQEV